MCTPEPLQSRNRAKGVFSPPRGEQPVQSRSDVVELQLEPVEPLRLLHAYELALRFECQLEEPLRVTLLQLVEAPFSGLALERVLADGSQHRESQITVR